MQPTGSRTSSRTRPEAKITILTLRGEEYALEVEIRAGHTLAVSQPFALRLDPVSFTEFG